MVERPNRLVSRIQRRLHSIERGGPAVPPTTREVAELEARVRRLRAFGTRFTHVRLSQYVAACVAAEVPNRIGGECVATDV